jgi:hypothetical protein
MSILYKKHESILVIIIFFFLFQLSFQMQIFEIRVASDQGINCMPNFPNCSPLLNSFQKFIFMCHLFLNLENNYGV